MLKRCSFSSCHERGTKKKKFWVSMRNRTFRIRPSDSALRCSDESEGLILKVRFLLRILLFLLKTWLQMGRVKFKNLAVPLASRLQLWLNYAFENSLLTISSFLIIQLCDFFLRPTKRFVVFVAWVWRLSLVIWFILSSQLLFVMSTLFWLSVVVT